MGINMIRYACKDDISRIAEIQVFGKRVAYRSIFQDDIGSFHKLQVLDIIQEYQQNARLLENILVYDDGIIKGIINGKESSGDAEADKIELCDFYVEPFFKRQGIGQELFAYFEREVRRKGKKKIYLWVIEQNDSARKFYEANGFTFCGQKRLIEDTKVMDICYEKVLIEKEGTDHAGTAGSGNDQTSN